MRILVQTLGSAGDVHPFLGIGAALRRRGHEVHLLANEIFGDAVRAAGIEFVPCGTRSAFVEATSDPDLWHPRKGLETVMRTAVVPVMEPAYETLRERLVPGDTVLVTSTFGFSARLLSETHGTPLVTAHLAPMAFRSGIRPLRVAGMPDLSWMPSWFHSGFWWLADKTVDRMVCPALNALRRKLGLTPVTRVFHEWVNSGNRLVGLFPEWFAPPPVDWPEELVLTGFPLFDDGARRTPDPALDAWLSDAEPPVVFTAGSANIHGKGFFEASVRAVVGLGTRGLLVSSNPAVIPDPLPSGVRHATYAPFGDILPRAAAFVHHGGIGSTAQALACGTPQVLTPMAFDQFDNAAHVEALGVGVSIPARRYTARKVVRALERLTTSDAVRAACDHAAALTRMGDPMATVCDLIEGSVGDGHPHRGAAK